MNTLVANVQERRALLKSQLDALVATVERRGSQSFTPAEGVQFDALMADVRAADARIVELREQADAQARAAATRVATGEALVEQRSGPRWSVGTEPATYRREGQHSFFRDLAHAQRGDAGAIERLHRNNAEARALGNTGATGGSGGDFAPPGYLVDRWVSLARPGRVTADLFHREEMPVGVSSVNIPRISTGSAVGVQSTQNTVVPQADITTASLSSGITTLAGKQVVSLQLLEQSPAGFDEIVLADLTADYARQVGAMVLTGSGTSGALRGYLTAANTTVQTWTPSGTATAVGFYAQLAALQARLYGARFAAPDAIVLHPTRWAWLASSTDSTGRPLVSPTAGGFNSMAEPGAAVAAGRVGSLLGVDVFTDPNIPTTRGAGTNQDVALMFKRDDVWLWESGLRAESLPQVYGESLGVLLRVYNYSALIPDRYPAGLGVLTGAGMAAPTFAS